MTDPRARLGMRPRRALAVLGVLALTVLLSSCGDPVSPSFPDDGRPDELRFTLGGFAAAGSVVELRGDTLVHRVIPWDLREAGATIDSVRTVPSEAQWRDFWRAVHRLGVGRWTRRYMAEGIVDGVGWELRLEADGRRLEAHGSNAWPDRMGFEHEGDVTPDFRDFRAALGRLVGRGV